jgi:hypothetical protein
MTRKHVIFFAFMIAASALGLVPSLAGSPAGGEGAFRQCLNQGIRDAVRSALQGNMQVTESKHLADQVASECVLQIPGDVLLGDQAHRDAWLARATADLQLRITAEWPTIAAEAEDENQAVSAYYSCLSSAATALASVSTEPAEAIVKAAFPVCITDRAAVFERYRTYKDDFSAGAMSAMEKLFANRLLTDVIVARAQHVRPPLPTERESGSSAKI